VVRIIGLVAGEGFFLRHDANTKFGVARRDACTSYFTGVLKTSWDLLRDDSKVRTG
jgi:hypothetical protein